MLGADDKGLPGDQRTTVRQPQIVGQTDPGATVELLDADGAVVSTSVAAADGSFVLRPPALRPAPARFSVRAVDAAGNEAISRPFKLEIVGTPRDYDGNGVADLAVFRPETAEWLVALKDPRGETIGVRVERFGDTRLRDVPVPADYDGNGVADLAVFRPEDELTLVLLKDATGVTLGTQVTQANLGGLSRIPLEFPIGSLAALGFFKDSGGGSGSARQLASAPPVAAAAPPSTVSFPEPGLEESRRPGTRRGRPEGKPTTGAATESPGASPVGLRGTPARGTVPASHRAVRRRSDGEAIDLLIDQGATDRLRVAAELAKALMIDGLRIAVGPPRR